MALLTDPHGIAAEAADLPIIFPLSAGSIFGALGLPTRLSGAAEQYVIRSAKPALVDLVQVTVKATAIEVRVIHGRRRTGGSAFVRHRGEAIEGMERGLRHAATLPQDEQNLLIVNVVESASSAMNADAGGRLSAHQGYKEVRFVRGGAPGLGKRR